MTRTPGGIEQLPVAHRPDLHTARTWLRLMRRIDRVTISIRDDSASAHLEGVIHRLPVRRRIGVGAALGLRELRVPTVIEDH